MTLVICIWYGLTNGDFFCTITRIKHFQFVHFLAPADEVLNVQFSRWTSTQMRTYNTKYLHMLSTEQCLASFKILTPPPPPSPRSECVLPPHRRAVRAVGVNILEDARHWIGLLQYKLSTPLPLQWKFCIMEQEYSTIILQARLVCWKGA